jgi:hypothetical protein
MVPIASFDDFQSIIESTWKCWKLFSASRKRKSYEKTVEKEEQTTTNSKNQVWISEVAGMWIFDEEQSLMLENVLVRTS